ncbi:hypothetical protein PV646_34905 [Streptomyces sp. ID05-26A]|nr:hypothetical protein [Streptomyces sp. ID05-26A]
MDDSHRGVVGASVVVGFLLALFCAQSAWLGAVAALDIGRPGTYVVGEGFSCAPRTGCISPDGRFTSEDGEVIREEVRLDVDLPAHLGPGDIVPAYDIGDAEGVHSHQIRRDHRGLGILTLWGAGVVVVVMGTGYLWLTRKRT